jgi:hypothetical protein
LGVRERPQAPRQRGPGRKRVPIEDLARAARAYVDADGRGESAPLQVVRKALGGVSLGTARNRIFQARDRGLLTRRLIRSGSGKGSQGGELTPLAKGILARLARRGKR